MVKRLSAPNEIYVNSVAPEQTDVLWIDTDDESSGGGGGGGGGTVQSIVAGQNITVDNSDPANPVISATASNSGIDWQLIGILQGM